MLRIPTCFLFAVCWSVLSGADLNSSRETELRSVISQADLHYAEPVSRSEDGMPIGNGRMGTLVWTSPTALKFQINRVDVHPSNRDSRSFFERNSDYMGGCGFVDLDLGGSGPDVFTADGCPQHLSLYDGIMNAAGRGLKTRLLASQTHGDVIAVEIDDQRGQPQPVNVNLRMLRYTSQFFGAELENQIKNNIVAVRTAHHIAASQLSVHDGRIVLTQEFREGAHYAKSAVAIALVGRDSVARIVNRSEVRLAAPAAAGKFMVLMASAATLDPNADVVATALRLLDGAAKTGYDDLARAQADWWQAFWARGSLKLHSADGVADDIGQGYHYFLYLMASTSQGKYPPKFNGMLWNTRGDLRAWGSQHWFANLSCYYEALPATGRWELMDPMFDMYSGMYDSLARAAREQWGSQGIFLPETVSFDGLAALPDDIAAEMRDLYLLRKPWTQASARFKEFAATEHPHSSRWNWMGGGDWFEGHWVPVERGSGPYGPVTHIFGTTAKVAYLFWRRYEYTLDEAWLRVRAYPMLKGAAEFYRNYPNLTKDSDGRYHIHHSNSNESVWGCRDGDEDLSAMRGVLPAAIRASELLAQDEDLRGKWRELLANLPPLPTSADPAALRPADYQGPEIFVRGLQPAVQARGFTPDGNSLPMWFFDFCNVESSDPRTLALARATFDHSFRDGIGPETRVSVLSKQAIAAASLGRADAVRHLIPNQMHVLTTERETAYRRGRPLANRMTLREGPQATDAQAFGRAAEAVNLALLQSNPPAPAEAPILRLFPAWPKDWDAQFTLRARGGFVVTAAQKAGAIERLEIRSEAGAPCRLRNPWGERPVTLVRDGRVAEQVSGSLLNFPTRSGERIEVRP